MRACAQPVQMVDYVLGAGSSHSHDAPLGFETCMVYAYAGAGAVNGRPLALHHIAVLDAASDAVRGVHLEAGPGGLSVMLFAGKRLNQVWRALARTLITPSPAPSHAQGSRTPHVGACARSRGWYPCRGIFPYAADHGVADRPHSPHLPPSPAPLPPCMLRPRVPRCVRRFWDQMRGQPIAWHGPFVMTTDAEIRDTIASVRR
jgi:hypothetical protein